MKKFAKSVQGRILLASSTTLVMALTLTGCKLSGGVEW
ncbi:hypothetical protein EDF62_3019 [Leucobacter luti]|uniref:Uncharacterized protein n=1 Tax=Leucobacter luti TaxID=340320 RepID=A0A4R6RSE4_9MICO|nr:hypothetical protein EDF62_3019 [Leucobacter luti]